MRPHRRAQTTPDATRVGPRRTGSRNARGAGRHLVALLAASSLAALLVLTAIVVSACTDKSGSQTDDESRSAFKSSAYIDDDFGFSFEYPDSWQIQHIAPSELAPAVAKEVSAFDLQGSDVGDNETWDIVSVEVYEGGEDLGYTLDELSQIQTDYLAGYQQSSFELEVLQSPTAITVGGLSGYKITYRGLVGGDQLHASEYMLLDDTLIYNLWTQSIEENWDDNQQVFADFLSSFSP